MNTEINNIVLTSSISETISILVVICFHFSIFEPLETADYK